MTQPQTQRDYKQRILAVLVHIQKHLDDALDLETLARIANFSPYHFHRVFRGLVGESLMQHIRRLRLERAALRLKHTHQPVTHIAFEAGFETHEAFTRAFRRTFDQAPSQFRESHQSIPMPSAASGVHYVADGQPEDFVMQTSHPPVDVRVLSVPPRRVAFIRHIGPYNEVGETWGKLMAFAGQRGLFGPQSLMLGVCHDDPEVTPPEKIRYDACLTVGEDFQPEGEVGVQTLEGGDYAVAEHRGPYEKLGETYAALCGQWLATSGREPRSAPGFEVYRNSPMNTAPEDLVTDIYLPLEPQK